MIYIMWLKQCHKPPIWEWFIPPIQMVMTGGWSMALFYPKQATTMDEYGFISEERDSSRTEMRDVQE